MSIDLGTLPVRITRKAAAALISQYYFSIAPRTLEKWPLDEVYVGGRIHFDTRQVVAEAERRLAAAGPAPQGRKRNPAESSATAQN
jgi:hypothetical protein